MGKSFGGRARSVVVLLVVTFVVSACGSTQPSPPPTTSAVPTANPSGGPSASPTGPAADWASFDIPPLNPAASLTPTKSGDAGAAADTAFTLKSLDGTPVATLASQLTVQPAVTFRADPPQGDTVTLHPATALAVGTTYHFKLSRADGSLAGAWGVTTAKPLHIVGTLPDDEATDVPVDTGIEVTFDQSGITGDALRPYFKITPAVDGAFEVHGRVVAFVPAKPLKILTVYTLTIRHGLPLPGTGQVLGADKVVRFETRANHTLADRLVIGDKLVDAGTADPPVVALSLFDETGNGPTVPKSVPVTVYRLAGLSAAIKAYDTLSRAPDWARTGGAPVDVTGLPKALSATLSYHAFPSREDGWVQLPKAMSAGWYLVSITHGGERSQAVLQVTDVATYAFITDTRSAIWVNDLKTGKPIEGATLTLGTRGLGRTGANGLRIVTTPRSAVVAPGDTDLLVLTVRDGSGRSMFVPIDRRGVCGKCEVGPDTTDDIDAWWHLFALDRGLFRSTDHANVWGMVRARDGGALPKSLDVRLVTTDDSGSAGATIAEEHPTPTSTGAFTSNIAFTDLPPGTYDLQLRADGVLIADAFLTVGPIVKPGYTLDVTTNKRAVLVNDPVTATVKAAFFEGTPVAGTDLDLGFVGGDEADAPATARTDADGLATVTVKAPPLDDGDDSQWTWMDLQTAPRLPEEAGIEAAAAVAVFRSTALLATDATLKGTRLTVTGNVHDVAFDRFTADVAPFDDSIDPNGAPRGGAKVTVSVDEVSYTRRQTGTTYDFITKRATPTYEYVQHRRSLGTRTVTTDADGRFSFDMTVKGGTRGYEIASTYTDEGRRTITSGAFAERTRPVPYGDQPSLVVPNHENDQVLYSVGDAVEVTFSGAHADTAGDRYLFTVSHRGLQSARVQSGPTFTSTFKAASIPNVLIEGVRFTGSTYEIAGGYGAQYRIDDRRLKVTIKPDAAHYEPGGHVSATVTVADRNDHPVAASVVVRVIDEKLYAIGAASDVDPLTWLYQDVSSGVTAVAWSHHVPVADDGGGDTTGGGGEDGRDDFRDWLVFRLVTTGADGTAKVAFDLSDDLTSWRMSAAALDGSIRAGTGTVNIPVGLPFFAEATIAPEYLASDHPIIRLRGFGSALHSGDAVSFAVSSADLGMTAVHAQAAAFTAADVPLPALSVGDHEIRIAATSGSGASQHQDTLVRTIHVVTSRAVQSRTVSAPVDAAFVTHGSSNGLTTVVLSDAGRGRVVPVLLALTGGDTGRADEALAAALAQRVLKTAFGYGAGQVPASDADLASFQTPDGDVALFPYASGDLELSALAALTNDPRIDPVALGNSFGVILDDGEATRDRRITALAGEAALGMPVLDMIRAAAAEPTLQPGERVWLAIAALAAGDETLAATLERALLHEFGQRLGPWVRLSLADAETTSTTTALLGIVAAGLGDPLAADLDAYVDANPPKDTLTGLQRAIAASYWAERTPVGPTATVSLTLDGATKDIAVASDAPVSLTFTPDQVARLRLAPKTGTVLATTTWDAPIDPSSLHAVEGLTFERTVTPSGEIGADQVVTVDFAVTLPDDAAGGCWQVTDLVPSGLAPLGVAPLWPDEEETPTEDQRTEGPWRITGQRVDFCVSLDPRTPTHQLRYVARVVTPGTYAWEPAVIQSQVVQERGIVLPAFTLTIRGGN